MKVLKVFVCILLFWSLPVLAQRNIDFVIPFAPGGTADRLALSLIGPIREELSVYGINPVLTYRPGGGSTFAAASVAKSDKLQILLAPNAVVTAAIVNPSAANYNVEIDFVPLQYLGHSPMLLVVHYASGIQSIADLQRECRKRSLTYGSAGIGSATHIASSIVLHTLKCPGVHVPYKGVGPALFDLQGRHIDLVTDFVTSVKPLIESQILRPILSVDRNRNTDYAKLPNMSIIGHNDYDFYNWFVIMVNSSADAEDIFQVSRALDKMMKRADIRDLLTDAGLREIAKPIPRWFLSQEYQKFKTIINRLNIDAR